MNDAAENLRWQRKTICGPRLWPPHLVLTLCLAPVSESARDLGQQIISKVVIVKKLPTFNYLDSTALLVENVLTN